MAKISTYPVDSSLSGSDLLIGTDADNANATKNYSLGDIAAFVQSLAPANTLQEVLDAGNTATQDIYLTGDITILGATNFINAANSTIGNLRVTANLKDSASSSGTSGQVLTSVGLATLWQTIDLDYVLGQGNIATQGIQLTSYLKDVLGNNGTLGQVLTATASNTVKWTSLGLQEILDANNSATEDINLVGQISTQNLWVQAALYDSTGFAGTNGQLLVTTGGTLTTLWTTVDLDYVLGQGNSSTTSISLTGSASVSAPTVEATQSLIVGGTLEDSASSYGTNGQLLMSVITGTEWTTISLQEILDANNTAIENINLTGTITVDSILCNTDIKLLGTITDGNTSIGTPGQVLTATGGNVLWEDAEAAFTSYRGSFYSLVDQTLTAANTAKAIILEVTDAAATNGVSITSDGVNLTRITFAHAGVYNVVFSAQLDNSAGSSQTASFWLRKNGLILADNVPNTNGKVELQGSTNHVMAAWNYFIDVAAGDFIHLMFAATSTNISLVHDAASGPSPATPSIIVTVNKV